MTRTLTAVGAHVYAGGFAVGIKENFTILAHLEEGNFGVDTFRANFPGVPVYTDRRDWPISELAGRVAVFYGNPPCAPWSAMGTTISKRYPGGWREDPRVEYWRNITEAALAIEPDAFVGESVIRFYTAGSELVQEISREWLSRGYAAYYLLHDIKFMGAAQQRRRVFTIFSRFELTFPRPTVTVPVTVRQALEGLSDIGPYEPLPHHTWEAYEDMTPEKGRNCLRDAWDNQNPPVNGRRRKGRPRFVEYMIDLDKPTGTIFGTTQIHPHERRYLSSLEIARIMGYPDNYVWSTSPEPGYMTTEMVRAVTPFAARYISRVLASGIRRGKPAHPRATEVNYTASSMRIMDYRMQDSHRDVTDGILGGTQ